MFSGLVWTGSQKRRAGLADAFGSVDSVAREVIKAERVVDFSQKENVAERLARRFGAGVASAILELAQRASVSPR
jgi:protease IV